MTKPKDAKSQKPPKKPKPALVNALRENLKRRKVAAQPAKKAEGS